MTRRIIVSASSVLLLLCLMTAAIWAGSYAIVARPSAPHAPGFCWLRIDEGNDYLVLARGRLEEWISTPWDGKWYRETSVPLWALALVFLAAALGLRVLAGRIPVTRRPGLCPSCAYDLTANASGVCPECGKPTGAVEVGRRV